MSKYSNCVIAFSIYYGSACIYKPHAAAAGAATAAVYSSYREFYFFFI